MYHVTQTLHIALGTHTTHSLRVWIPQNHLNHQQYPSPTQVTYPYTPLCCPLKPLSFPIQVFLTHQPWSPYTTSSSPTTLVLVLFCPSRLFTHIHTHRYHVIGAIHISNALSLYCTTQLLCTIMRKGPPNKTCWFSYRKISFSECWMMDDPGILVTFTAKIVSWIE